MKSMLGAVLWDMDGTLVNTIDWHVEAWLSVFEREGHLTTHEHLADFSNRVKKGDIIISQLLEKELDSQEFKRLKQAKDTIYYERLQDKHVSFCAGALAWLERFQSYGVTQALVSATLRRNIDFFLTQTSLESYLKLIISRDDVLRGKPNPEPFLLAAQRLGVAPQQCLVIGDTSADVEGGRAAGMRTIALRTTVADLEGDVTVDSLEVLTEAHVLALLGTQGLANSYS